MPRRTAEPTASRLLVAYWLPAALCAAAVLFLGSRPNLKPPVSFPFVDKLLHMSEYGVLGILLTRAVRASWDAATPAALAALCLGVAIGTADEVHQAQVPGRSSDAFDLLADTAGLALAPFAMRAFTRARGR
jgi:VanZ family protein